MALSVTLLPLLQAFVLERHKAEVFQVSAHFSCVFLLLIVIMPKSNPHCDCLANKIDKEGYLSPPCLHYVAMSTSLRMSYDCKRLSPDCKCNNCVHSGIKYEQDFIAEQKWQMLEYDCMQIAADLEDAE